MEEAGFIGPIACCCHAPGVDHSFSDANDTVIRSLRLMDAKIDFGGGNHAHEGFFCFISALGLRVPLPNLVELIDRSGKKATPEGVAQ
jgi:hypothetical protein